MFIDYLCILGMNSMYVYYTGFSLVWGWGAENLLILPPPKKILPSRLPHQLFTPPPPPPPKDNSPPH